MLSVRKICTANIQAAERALWKAARAECAGGRVPARDRWVPRRFQAGHPSGGNSVRGPSDERNAPDGPVQVSPLVGLGLKPRSPNGVIAALTSAKRGV